jgi:ubiquinone/menaquinone biosynthesis C-methylase UbiE
MKASASGEGGSAQRSRAFYRALGAAGLAIRTRPDWDAQVVEALRLLLPPTGRVLDVGCGYGRIALRLVALGYEVTGIDVAPNLLRAARREAARRGLPIRLDHGSMTVLPYPPASFDAVVCIWTAFHELLREFEQVAALREMHRVLAPGGVGVVDGPPFEPATADEIASGARSGPGNRIASAIIAGQRIETYAHDAESLHRVADAAGLARRRVVVRDWAGRDRQILLFEA